MAYTVFLPHMMVRAEKEQKLSIFWAYWSECTKKIFVDMKDELDAKGHRDYHKQYLAELALHRKMCELYLCDLKI